MFLNSSQIIDNAKNRKIVFWGCSEDWVPKSKSLLPQCNLITDMKYKIIGNKWMDLKMISPNEIFSKKSKYYVVVTTGRVDSVKKILDQNDFKSGLDYAFSPVFEDFKAIQDFKNFSFKILFSSSDFKNEKDKRASKLGGGIFEFIIEPNNISIKKVINIPSRQFSIFKNKIYSIDFINNRINIHDAKYKKIDSIKLSYNHYTGIALDNRYIYVICSAEDVIEIYSKKNNQKIHEVPFGRFSKNSNSPYHLNDCFLFEDKLFFSYFSESGFWRNEIFDGGISYMDTKTFKIHRVISNLKQPHSPKMIENSLHYCESMLGKVFNGNSNEILSLNGFIRGIDFQKGFYFIGQSETMYLSRFKNFNPISINSGIHLYSTKTKLSKFYPSLGIKNIHHFEVIGF